MNKRLVARELIKIAKMLRASEELSPEAAQFLKEWGRNWGNARREGRGFDAFAVFNPPSAFLALVVTGDDYSVHDKHIDQNPKAYFRCLNKMVNAIKKSNEQITKSYSALSKEAKNQISSRFNKNKYYTSFDSVFNREDFNYLKQLDDYYL